MHILKTERVDGYEKLLYDALHGDQSHFVHADEVMESWRIVDDLLCVGDQLSNSHRPRTSPGGWGPQHKVNSIANWDYPA